MRTFISCQTQKFNIWMISPILTFGFLLLLPSCLTLVTLLVHRVRASRAAQRDRAPEEMVKSLPSRIWNGTGLEKTEDATGPLENADSERGSEPPVEGPSTYRPVDLPWHELQFECAICLSNFAKGETVRVLPCQHIFHIDEVDAWLINGKKLVCPFAFLESMIWLIGYDSVPFARLMSRYHC